MTIASGVSLAAFLSGVSAALEALGEDRLHAIADGEGRQAKIATKALDRLHAIRARLRLGRVIGIAAASSAATYVSLGGGIERTLLAIALVVLGYGFVAGALAALCRQMATRWAVPLLAAARPLELILAPLAWPIVFTQRSLTRAIEAPEDDRGLTAAAVEHMIERGEESGGIEENHAQLLLSVLEFKETLVREVMVPRPKMVAFSLVTPVADVIERIEESGHSRYPVYAETIDEVVGVLYAKDLYRVAQDGIEEVKLGEVVRRPVFLTQESSKIETLLREMQSRRLHLAVAVDEFGGTVGIVTLEDILEEIVGEIEDEHDDEVLLLQDRGHGRYVVDAAISVHDLAERIGAELPEGEYESLGGMVAQLAGRVPKIGDRVLAGSIELHVLEADSRHVTRVEVRTNETTRRIATG